MRNRSGQALLEYVMLVALIALLMVAALVAFERTLGSSYEATAEKTAECIQTGPTDCD